MPRGRAVGLGGPSLLVVLLFLSIALGFVQTRAQSTDGTSLATTPTVTTLNPIYAPGLTAGELVKRALPYADASAGVRELSTVHGSTPVDWKAFFPTLRPKAIEIIDASGFRAALYTINGQPVLAFAPTAPVKNPSDYFLSPDWKTNWENLILGTDFGNRWKNRQLGTNIDWKDYQSIQNQFARVVGMRLHQQYPNLIVTGLSKGGGQAAYVGALEKIPAVTFNPAAPHFGSNDKVFSNYVLNFRIQGEFAGLSGPQVGHTITIANQLTAAPGIHPIAQHDIARFREAYEQLKRNPSAAISTVQKSDGLVNLNIQKRVLSPSTPREPSKQLSGPTAGSATLPSPRVLTTFPSNAGKSPGGISLNKAAAERMNLNIDLEGSYYDGGRIILSGRPRTGSIDAALFLTALRLACERDDPYFSLDPDNGKEWSDAGQALASLMWDRVRNDFELGGDSGLLRWDKIRDGLLIKAISARRDYPDEWVKIARDYPNFRTRLVFRPDWLRHTRFGDILYQADVLLKELSAGKPALSSSTDLRALAIERYVASDSLAAARQLLANVRRPGAPKTPVHWKGHRLWFDLVADTASPTWGAVSKRPEQLEPNSAAATLYAMLRSRGYWEAPIGANRQVHIAAHHDALDVSRVYPKMYVRQHNHETRQDISGADPDLETFSSDLNRRPGHYAEAYKEFRDLVDSFRAYIVAVKAAKQDSNVCRRISGLPLMDTEKSSKALPEYHPSELFFTVATYTYSKKRERRRFSSAVTSTSGGIALRGKSFLTQSATESTEVTAELARELAKGIQAPVWQGSSGRHFVALILDNTAVTSVTPPGPSTTPPTVASVGEMKPIAGGNWIWWLLGIASLHIASVLVVASQQRRK